MFTRILWALILAPPVLLAIHFGPPYSDLLVGLAAALTLWEWSRLCSDGRLDPAGWAAIATGICAVALGAFRLQDLAAWVLAAGAMLVAVLAMRGRPGRTLWLLTGVVYLGAACLAFQWLRQQGIEGRNLVYWLLILV